MKLALLLGSKGNEIKPKLVSIKDNLDIDVFNSVPAFIDMAIKKGTFYDRILLISNILDEQKITDLHAYWKNYCKDTEIVCLCKKGQDEALANVFITTFTSINVVPMLVFNTNMNTIADAILLQPKVINAQYGIKDYLDSETLEDEVVVQEDEKVSEPVSPEPEQVSTPPQVQQNKKKNGFFSTLFGGKKKQQNPSVNNTVQTSGITVEDFNTNDDSSVSEDFDNFDASDFDEPDETPNFESDLEEKIDSNIEDITENSDANLNSKSSIPEPDLDEAFDSDDFDTAEFSQNVQSDNNNASINNIYDNEYTKFDNYVEKSDEFNNNEDISSSQDICETDDNEVEDDIDFTSIAQPKFTPVKNVKNDFEVEVEEDIDFQSFGRELIEGDEVPDTDEVLNVEEVDDTDLELGNASDAEEKYREESQPTRIVTNTVVKEVIRTAPSGGIGKSSILKKVLDGQINKTIVVTGDRGTGITLTAYNLAKKFAEKVPVLYVDLDTETHGLLNYIDYGLFQSYENVQIHGLKYCTNSRNFDKCTIRFDNNFDIIGSDFSSEITDEEIEQASNIIAENLGKYGLVVVDCPVSKLNCIPELILTANTVLCVEGSKRGFMNMLCVLENSPLSTRYKRTIVNRGTMLVTKCNPKIDIKQLIKYINKIFTPDSVDWLSMDWAKFTGKFSVNLLNNILEG